MKIVEETDESLKVLDQRNQVDIQKYLIEIFLAGFGSDQQQVDKRYMGKVCQLYLPVDLDRPSELSQRALEITIP